MKKQYSIQMLVNGEWVMARIPSGQGYRVNNLPTSRETAEKDIAYFKEWWEIANHHNQPVPTEYRIVSRVISEWEAE